MMDGQRQQVQLAVRLHKSGDIKQAISTYRTLCDCTSDFGPLSCILLANLLLTPAEKPVATDLAEAMELAKRAHAAAPHVTDPACRSKINARYGFFQLQRYRLTGDATVLASSITSLQQCVAADPRNGLAWRNLSMALKAAERWDESERAIERAVEEASRGGSRAAPTAWLHLLTKVRRSRGDVAGSADVLCDIVTRDPQHTLAVFWLRVALQHAEALPPHIAAKVRRTLQCRSGTDSKDAITVPHVYISQLFDSYASAFDSHLTGALQYRTPNLLLQLALSFNPNGCWDSAADLGCGTGLAGVAFRSYIKGRLAGVDLSAGMVAEAHLRRQQRTASASELPLYDELAVSDIESWLAADRVHKFDLASLFASVSKAMASPAVHDSHPASFVFSTESDPESAPGPGHRLTATGRCAHKRSYIASLAEATRLTVAAVEHAVIRKNKGQDVEGDLYVLQKL
jgi:predicted TPR repeat methyltransferase